MSIAYRELKRYKYQLLEDYSLQIELEPPSGIVSAGGWICLDDDGMLWIKSGYCWDGASGPTVDTPSSMRGSLVHDALYQLMREGLMPQEARPGADALFWEIVVEDGMPRWRAWYYRKGLRFAGFAAEKNEGPEIVRLTAP